MWLTGDSLKKVEAHYKKQGMKSMSAEVYMTRLMKFQKTQTAKLVATMKSGGDPQAMQAGMKSIYALTKSVSPGYVFSDPQDQLHLGKEVAAGDTTMIEYQVVIWRARELNKTGIAIDFKGRKK